ncbi:hydroxymethylglutaryl-CoA reductase [Candidatus Daviesbacteria bacterium]|nr:hydroxymethylglutaryl-CoA reductase [Candidatus Daviesbacteria bacterium]
MYTKLSLRNFSSARKRREFLENQLKVKLENLASFTFTEDQVKDRSIENLIGATQIPLGVAGPLAIKNNIVIPNEVRNLPSQLTIQTRKIATGRTGWYIPRNDQKEYYIPLATTEGALVASISRGCKAVTQSEGAYVVVENIGQTRGPVFKTTGLEHGLMVKQWINSHISLISQTTQKTSSHLKLLKIDIQIIGKNLFLRFYYDTSDAMGMNMVTIATLEAVKLIERQTQAQCISLAGNFDIDKKPAWLNFIEGRGKKVWAEISLDKKVVKEVLKSTPQKIAEVVYRKNQLGSIMSGSLGFNAHYANIIAALFIATGQDPAHVVEGSLGVTTAEVLDNGDLYFSIYLPSLVVGIVGGGTHLPTQQEALKIMQVKDVLEYCQVSGAAVLAGELSLIASLAEGSLATAHRRLGRKNRR